MNIEYSLIDFYNRIQELSKLRQGWLDGDGEQISFEMSHLVVSEVEKHFRDCLPHVFPMPSGGLSLEWFKGNDEVCALIEPDFKGMFISNNESSKADWSLEQEWTRLKRNVLKFMNK